MWRAFLAEWPRIRRTSVLAAFAAMLLMSLLGGYFGITRITSRPDAALAILRFSRADGLVTLLRFETEIISLVALVTIGAVIGADWSGGTWRNLLVQEPRRARQLAGRFLALLLYLWISGMVAVLVAAAIATAVSPGVGIQTALWWTGDGLTYFWELLGNLSIAVVGWSIFGLLIAVLTRNGAGAVGASIGWLFVVEGILMLVWPDVARWMPGTLLNTIVSRGNAQVTYNAALIWSAVYAVAMAIVAAVIFAVRDVTA